jgi:hypothetical protein
MKKETHLNYALKKISQLLDRTTCDEYATISVVELIKIENALIELKTILRSESK